MVPLIKQCWIRPWVRKEKNGRKEKKKDQGSRRLLIINVVVVVLFCFISIFEHITRLCMYGFVGHVLGSAEYSEI